MQKNRSRRGQNEGGGSDSSLVLSLSLFILLLAFFIVMNGLSEYSKPKMDQAFDSIDLTFSTQFVPSDFTKMAMDEREKFQGGSGDSIDEIEGVLTSILPNLNIEIEKIDGGGRQMSIRISKERFEKVANDLIPMFVRVLNEKDQKQKYALVLTSYVRDPLHEDARRSLNVIKIYTDRLVDEGLPPYRISNVIAKGNPAILSLSFVPVLEGQ